MFIIRFMLYFCLSFAILCIPVGNERQLFNSLSDLLAPHVGKVFDSTKQKISTTAHYSKKLYSNSEPQYNSDTIKSKMAAIKKSAQDVVDEADQLIEEDLTGHEELRLRNILNDE